VKLRIAKDLVLAADFITSTQAILAQKGKGKSHLAAVEAEEMLEANQLVVIIDPTDAHYGLRSSPDGRSTGYPIAVFGGDHGDVQLEPGGGSVLAEAIVDERFSAIICTETMTKSQELRFVGDFLETLYRKNREAMHLFIDEADMFAKQSPFGEETRTTGATDDIVRRGRKKGIGVTLITQRASVLNKNVLSQADMLIAMGCSHPLDLEAIDKWVRSNADAKLAKEMISSLPSLPRGEAWVWNPAQHIFKRIAVRQRHTFDSGATPKAGEKKREPKILAPVDIARLGQSMAAAIERQKATDPKTLKAEVLRLRKINAELEAQQVDAKAKQKAPTAPKIVEKRAIAAKDLKRLEIVVERMNVKIDNLGETRSKLIEVRDDIVGVSAFWAGIANKQQQEESAKIAATKIANIAATKIAATRSAMSTRPIAPAVMSKRLVSAPAMKDGSSKIEGLAPAHLRILSAIAWWESIGIPDPDLGGVAFAAKTSIKSSSFNNNRSRLRAAGYIDYPSSGLVRLTKSGREIAPPPEMPPTNEAIQQAILAEVTPAHGRMLRVVIDEYPNEISLEEFATRSGTTTSSSSFNNNRSWLKARGLVTYPRPGCVRAADLMFPEDR